MPQLHTPCLVASQNRIFRRQTLKIFCHGDPEAGTRPELTLTTKDQLPPVPSSLQLWHCIKGNLKLNG